MPVIKCDAVYKIFGHNAQKKIQSTNGKGIENIKTTKKNGKVIDSFVVNEKDQIILVSDKGQIIRVNINQVRIAGRSTQGVSVFKIPDLDRIVNVSRVQEVEEKINEK